MTARTLLHASVPKERKAMTKSEKEQLKRAAKTVAKAGLICVGVGGFLAVEGFKKLAGALNNQTAESVKSSDRQSPELRKCPETWIHSWGMLDFDKVCGAEADKKCGSCGQYFCGRHVATHGCDPYDEEPLDPIDWERGDPTQWE